MKLISINNWVKTQSAEYYRNKRQRRIIASDAKYRGNLSGGRRAKKVTFFRVQDLNGRSHGKKNGWYGKQP